MPCICFWWFSYWCFYAVATMDPNAEILIELARLRNISASFRGGNEMRRSLASTMDAIVDTISPSTNSVYDITSYREWKIREMVDGLDYDAIKKLRISKELMFALFKDPRTGEIPDTRKPHISIEWCTYQVRCPLMVMCFMQFPCTCW